jgi:hypothetical protein
MNNEENQVNEKMTILEALSASGMIHSYLLYFTVSYLLYVYVCFICIARS